MFFFFFTTWSHSGFTLAKQSWCTARTLKRRENVTVAAVLKEGKTGKIKRNFPVFSYFFELQTTSDRGALFFFFRVTYAV